MNQPDNMTEEQKTFSPEYVEKWNKAFSKYVRIMKENFKYIKELYPEDVQEAHRIMYRMGEIISDSSIEDGATLQKVLFDEIPREKLKWALEAVENKKTIEELRVEDRQRQKERRNMLGDDIEYEERRLTEDKKQELYEKVETMSILHAVDLLDEIRSYISDDFSEGGVPKPPELRFKLMELHEKAHNIINLYDSDTDEGLFDLAWDIEEELFDIEDKIGKIRKIVNKLTDLTPQDEE